ncbi:MAG: aldehyde dehydrogenase family protein [Bacteroidota bacterium]|nr:aldehyde dehydrogenase family protein [Candidatus Kapabacteria bacterium]MDW8220096.1 aldehyde dehydrogenase family protein [Bacteroidota bacterium]
MERFKNYINGAWVDALSGKTFQNLNPADQRDCIGEFPESDAADIDAAVKACKAAERSWMLTPAPKRGDILRRAGDIFTRRKTELSRIMTREMGKPTFETAGDVQEAIDTCYYAATEGRRLFGYTAPSELENKMNLSFRMPVGVCGIITAWNFPIAVPSWKIIPALLCGNTVVFKPSEDAPHSAVVFAEILEEAGVPPGVFNVVHGKGASGAALVEHPAVRLIAFTGSTQTGTSIAARCGALNKKCSLEMGGKNALAVMEDADQELALEGVLWGAFGTTGQRCTATSRLIVHKDIYEEFTNKLITHASKLRLGSGLEPDTQVGPVINERQLEKIERYIQIGRDEGATLALGGGRDDGPKLGVGLFVKPTIFLDVTPSMRIFREEIFGPVLAVTKAESFEHAIELINDCEYGLSSSIFTSDVNRAFRAIRDIEAGITYINAPTIGAEAHMPFGGVKGTGNGHREGGWTAYDIFTEWKTVYVDFSSKLQRAQIDNY